MPKFVEGKFQKLDWSNPASRPSLAFELGLDNELVITLSPSATEDQEMLIAVWTQPGPQVGAATSKIVRRSKPLRDEEHALALLNAFAKGNNDFESSVEWEANRPDPGN